jgi:hypothetical protein
VRNRVDGVSKEWDGAVHCGLQVRGQASHGEGSARHTPTRAVQCNKGEKERYPPILLPVATCAEEDGVTECACGRERRAAGVSCAMALPEELGKVPSCFVVFLVVVAVVMVAVAAAVAVVFFFFFFFLR